MVLNGRWSRKRGKQNEKKSVFADIYPDYVISPAYTLAVTVMESPLLKTLSFIWDYLFILLFSWRHMVWNYYVCNVDVINLDLKMNNTLMNEQPLTAKWLFRKILQWRHIMSTMASQITSLTTVYSAVYSRRRSKKTSKLRVTGLCVGNSPVTVDISAQRASYAENVSIWWRYHEWFHNGCRYCICHIHICKHLN